MGDHPVFLYARVNLEYTWQLRTVGESSSNNDVLQFSTNPNTGLSRQNNSLSKISNEVKDGIQYYRCTCTRDT